MDWHLQRLVVRSVKLERDKGMVLTFRCPNGENSHQQCGDKLLDQERIDPRVHKRDRAAAVVSGLHDARQGLREELTRTMRKERGRCGLVVWWPLQTKNACAWPKRCPAATVIVTVAQTQRTRARVRPPLSALHCAGEGIKRLTQRVQKQSFDGPQLSERSPQGGRK